MEKKIAVRLINTQRIDIAINAITKMILEYIFETLRQTLHH